MHILDQIKLGVLNRTEEQIHITNEELDIVTTGYVDNAIKNRIHIKIINGYYNCYISTYKDPFYGLQVSSVLLWNERWFLDKNITFKKITDIYIRHRNNMCGVFYGSNEYINHDAIDNMLFNSMIINGGFSNMFSVMGYCTSHYEFKNNTHSGTRDGFIILPNQDNIGLSVYSVLKDETPVGIIISRIK